MISCEHGVRIHCVSDSVYINCQGLCDEWYRDVCCVSCESCAGVDHGREQLMGLDDESSQSVLLDLGALLSQLS